MVETDSSKLGLHHLLTNSHQTHSTEPELKENIPIPNLSTMVIFMLASHLMQAEVINQALFEGRSGKPG